MKTISVITLLICLASPMVAQHWMDDGDSDKDRMREKVEDLRKMKLLEVLDLKDDQVEKFFAVYNKHTKRILDLREKVLDDAKELQSMIQKGAPDADLVSATASLRNTIKELGQEFDARFESVKPTLKLNQFAKYVVFEARFQDELQKMVMKRLRKQRDD
ncbi:MAG: hypothetical protein HYX66_02575 [Ignavibacteria bacterium]|nr:hypothetical protein [Ignavibacteria bacterium]